MDIFYIHRPGILVTVATKAQAEPGLHGAPPYVISETVRIKISSHDYLFSCFPTFPGFDWV